MSKRVKALVGVDSEGTYRSAVELCKRFKFANQEWVMVHALPRLPWVVPGLFPRMIPVATDIEFFETVGRGVLEEAGKMVQGAKVTDHLEEGDPARILTKYAEKEKANLLVIGSGQPKHDLLWMIGSVARAMSIEASESLLVVKEPAKGQGNLRVVFATDHSEYSNLALDQLIAWKPEGIASIDVVSAYEVNPATVAMLKRDTSVDLEFKDWIRDHCLAESEKMAEKLKAIAPEVNVIVEEGGPNDIIREAMKKSKADLLIVSAHGHGFLDRLVIGSTSHHQILAEPYPVLLMRLPRESIPAG